MLERINEEKKTNNCKISVAYRSGNAKIATYEVDELIATKLRALYQRRTEQNLFDLWYVTKNKLINLNRVFNIFAKYCTNDDSYFTKD
jgi:predicted nucleotidyltransferase component of viral defense system